MEIVKHDRLFAYAVMVICVAIAEVGCYFGMTRDNGTWYLLMAVLVIFHEAGLFVGLAIFAVTGVAVSVF